MLVALSSNVLAAQVTQSIKFDHFGYRPNDVKVAIFTANPGATVQIRNTSDTVVYTIPTNGGSIVSMGAAGQPSGDTVWQVNFTPFNTPGNYRLYSPSLNQQSYDFSLSGSVYNDVGKVALKTYYYQRCGVAHPQPFADPKWADPYVCHAYETATTAASRQPNYGTLDLSGGWHDAGDYNKYIWGDLELAMVSLMLAYENNPGIFYDGQLTIPGGSNGVPDILDEVKFEIDWLLKMQMPNGEVLSRVWDDYAGAPDSCPPSNAVQPEHYYGPDVDSGSIFTGSVAMFARICQGLGDPYGNVATLKAAAIKCWNNYLLSQGDSTLKCWAAAELWRLDPSITSARTYVENFYPDWAVWFDPLTGDTHAAYCYTQTPGADPNIVAKMKEGLSWTVANCFDNMGPYRNSMNIGYYCWGSNKYRGSLGVLLVMCAKLGATGSYTTAQTMELAEEYLHALHGQNAMGMVYLTNMAAYGGEHSSFQFYHSWFGAAKDAQSKAWYIGIPPGVVEPDFPYFKGVDNYGISDNNPSTYGPCPGFVVGGPNKDYDGGATPPRGATYYEKFYRDWSSDAPNGFYRTKCWEITENSISYQGPYVALIAAFMSAETPPPPDTTPPAAPSGLTATAVNSSQINLDWANNNESDLLNYTVYRSLTSGGPYTMRAGNVTVSAYSDIGLNASTTYYYVVTATDTSGNESAFSNQASATTPSSANTMHVSSIPNGGQKGKNPGRWADVCIVNNTGAPVSGATVTATFEGWDNQTSSNIIETKSGVTDSAGKARLTSAVDTGSLCVDNVTHATLVYEPGQNVVTCVNF
jgi:hypothetical protein